MATKRIAPASVDAYIASYPKSVQVLLKKVRATIKKAAPGSEERISYQIPAFKRDGQFVIYFAAFTHHIGLYPRPRGDAALEKILATYAGGKGTTRFPLDEPIPFTLITRMVKCRLRQIAERNAAKAKKKKQTASSPKFASVR